MSSRPGIEWALDKVAELAGRSGDGDSALEVLLVLVGALEPSPEAAVLEPAARRIGKLRLAQALDRPGDLRLGAARLLAALDAASSATVAPPSGSSSQAVPPVETASDDRAPVTPLDEPVADALRRIPPASKRRIVLSFPTAGSAVQAPPALGQVAGAAGRNGEHEKDSSPQPTRSPGTISGPHTVTVGSTLSLSGTAPPGDGLVTVEGSYDGGRTWEMLSSVESAQGRYATRIDLRRRGQLEMRIVFDDASSTAGSIMVR